MLEKHFINTDYFQPVTFALMTLFFFHFIYVLFLEKVVNHDLVSYALFALDAIGITFFLSLSDNYQSFYLFLFLINIALCGTQFKTKGAFSLALFSIICFNIYLVLYSEVDQNRILPTLAINNLTFLGVAYISGSLADRLHLVAGALSRSQKDVAALKNINDMIVNNIANGIITTDRSFKVTQSNSFAQSILKAKEIDGDFLEDYLIDINFDDLKGLEDSRRLEVERNSGSTQQQTVEVIVSPLVSGEEGYVGYLFLLQDLSEVKNLEKKLRQQEKLAAVGQLAAGIAHEIRNPLASISGSVQLMAHTNNNMSEEDQKLNKIILREIDRLNNLISEFLDYVRPEAKGEDVFDLSSMLKEILEMVKLNEKLNQNTEQDVELECANKLLGHKDKLKQAFLNVIINAYQAMEKVEDPKLSVRCFSKNSNIVVEVEDNGVGISKDSLERIFEPFHTTKAKGTGLGLAITHKVFEMHNATVDVISEVGQGTTFRMTFVTSDDPEEHQQILEKQA